MKDSLLELDSQQLLEILTSGALVVGEGIIQYANPALCDLSGYTPTMLMGRKLSEVLKLPPKTDCALCMDACDPLHPQWATFHGGFLLIENASVTEELRIKIKHSRLQNGWILCLIDPFSEDTTLTQAHSDFVSTVSHEFRTPLTSIKGFADTLLSYGAQLPDEEKRRFINIIKDQADRLIRLVENLLTASKLGASRVELSYRPIPLQRLFDKVARSVQAKAQAKNGLEPKINILVNPSDLEVWADADRLEQVLINLIDNAVKYSPTDSTVYIHGEFMPEEDSKIRISVRDEGNGIPEELLPKIFTKFYRVESPLKQEVEGTGLGLYITKSLTTAMGGQIFAESIPQQGSTFTVILPAATPELQAAHRRKLYASENDI
jgi:signal transduction histidine kinase